MFKLLKDFNKIIEGILFLILPIIVFYWSLTLLNIDIVRPLIAAVGLIIDPLIEPFRPYISYSMSYENMTVDYTVLLFAAGVLCTAFLFTVNGAVLQFIEDKCNEIDNIRRHKENLKQEEEERQAYIRTLNKNRTIYVIFRLIKNAPKESYLLKEGKQDFFSGGIIESYEKSVLEAYLKFGGEKRENTTDTENAECFIFYDIYKFLKFLPFLIERINEVNKGMFDLNVKFDYKIAAHCAYSDASAEADFSITSKILNLASSKEILLSELLKCRIDTLENQNFILLSQGIYLLNDKQTDVFKIEFS